MPEWRSTKKRRRRLTASGMEKTLEECLGDLPDEDEVVRLVTLKGYDAVGILRYIVERRHVRWLGIVSLRVGPTCRRYLESAAERGLIDRADFLLGHLSAMPHGDQRDDAERLFALCRERGWTMRSSQNHAKVYLFETDDGDYVVESSCNMNAIPNSEFFIVQRDQELLEFYRGVFFEQEEQTELPAEAPAAAETENTWQDPDSPLSCSKQKARATSPRRKLSSVRPAK